MRKKLRFYTDEHVHSSVVKGLRFRGIDVLTINEAKRLGAKNEDHIVFAKKEGRVIFTQSVVSLRVHAKELNNCGIVYTHQRTPIGDVIRGLMLLHQVFDYNDMQDHIEFL